MFLLFHGFPGLIRHRNAHNQGLRRSFNIQRRRQGYPGQFRELDPMNAIPAARKQPNKAKPDREADPRAKTRANPRCNCARTGHTHARAKRCAGRKRASGATPKTRFGDARATRVYENAFCRTLFILLETDPETPYRPKDYTSESYFKNKSVQLAPRWWWGSGPVNRGGGAGRVIVFVSSRSSSRTCSG